MNLAGRVMKIGGKYAATSFGVSFIAFAIVSSIIIVSSASEAQSPFLYLCIFGGLFAGVPAILGVALVREHLAEKGRNRSVKRT
jgi:hypothetical protein